MSKYSQNPDLGDWVNKIVSKQKNQTEKNLSKYPRMH